MSLAIQMTPIVGDAYFILMASVGFDPITGVSLTPAERLLYAGIGFIGLGTFGIGSEALRVGNRLLAHEGSGLIEGAARLLSRDGLHDLIGRAGAIGRDILDAGRSLLESGKGLSSSATQWEKLGLGDLRDIVARQAQAVIDKGWAAIDKGLSQAQKDAAEVQPWRIWQYRGTVVHNETYARLQAIFPKWVEYSSNRGLDFTFGNGIQIELTTVGSLSRHVSRYRDIPGISLDNFATYLWKP